MFTYGTLSPVATVVLGNKTIRLLLVHIIRTNFF